MKWHGRALAVARLLFACGAGVATAQGTVTARVVPTPVLPEPAYLQTVTDPAFGNPFTRISDPGGRDAHGLPCGEQYCTHRYSSAEAWNADASLLLITNGCHGLCFLDGQTYRPLFARATADECEWHPVDPASMICVNASTVYRWNPRSDLRSVLYQPVAYRDLQFGPYKGNLSRDGRKLVLRALDLQGNPVAFAYDTVTGKKFPDIRLDRLAGQNGFCSVSPTGRFILCAQTLADDTEQAYVLTMAGTQVQHWTEHHRPAHGDMTVDRDGSDVYVGISKSDPDRFHLIKRRLSDGAVTDLITYGEATHASLRNSRLPGWAFVTFTGTYAELKAHPAWAPFYQEIVAVRIDGSGEVRRLVQTRQVASGYWSEAHASPSPDGTQVIWSSNWGIPGGPVADYVARISWPGPQQSGVVMPIASAPS